MRGMAALQNMLSALPPSATPPDSTLAMWRGVLEMVGSSGGVAMCEEVTGLLAVLVEKMGEQNMQVCLRRLWKRNFVHLGNYYVQILGKFSASYIGLIAFTFNYPKPMPTGALPSFHTSNPPSLSFPPSVCQCRPTGGVISSQSREAGYQPVPAGG